jgi:hypothetical protein
VRGDFWRATGLLSYSFPHLRWLRLHDFEPPRHPEMVLDFFERHPQLESVSFEGCALTWFTDPIELGVLPNLQHLKVSTFEYYRSEELIALDVYSFQARFEDLRFLLPILPQLVSLGITKTYNGQAPYLLRALLPEGLPHLRSLEIEQGMVGWDKRALEGVLWYETVNGHFRTETDRRKMEREFTSRYLHSLVRGAPNLEELALHGMDLTLASLVRRAPPPDSAAASLLIFMFGIESFGAYAGQVHEAGTVLLSRILAGSEGRAGTPPEDA